MKKIAILVPALILFFSLSAQAIVEVGLEYGVSYENEFEAASSSNVLYSEENSTQISVYGVFFGFGLGLERINSDVSLSVNQSSAVSQDGFTVEHTLYHLFYRISPPLILVDLGLVFGNSVYETNTDSDSATTTGYMARLGYKILPLTAVTLSYKVLSTEAPNSNLASSDGTLISLGASFGF